MSKATYLSKKHGVNPSITQCWYCGKDDALVLFGRVGGQRAADMGWGNNPTEYDVEAPRKICCGPEYPCPDCVALMEKGIIFISVRDGEEKPEKGVIPNPYRTGGWSVLSEEYVIRTFTPDIVEEMLTSRLAFVEDKVWDELGLPRGKVHGVPGSMEEYVEIHKNDEAEAIA